MIMALKLQAADLHRVTHSHHQLLSSFLGSTEKAKDAIFYSYDRHINGFAANLEEEEAAEIAKHPDVVSVFPNKAKKLHTTHSWDFMSLENNGVVHPSSIWEKAKYGEDVIIANLDTGVWPEAESFNDEGYGPIPSRWKGKCNPRDGVTCNRKLIGARYFNKGYDAFAGKSAHYNVSARDYAGHGSHTLSTAGGNFVPGASVFGFGNGTAKGGSPRARVAAYKVCWPPVNGSECFDADILKGFDHAIHDGVDVISVSLGGAASDYFYDGISIGSFHAIKNGITVVCSGGNSGPYLGTVSNLSPWLLTVGASTLDREFQTYVELRNGNRFKGSSLAPALPGDGFYPLISGAQAKAAHASASDAIKLWILEKVKGKIVACVRGDNARVEKGGQVLEAGGAGMILCNDKASGNEITADPHVLPASHLTYRDSVKVLAYINSSKDPLGYITAPETQIGAKPAPFMASFSSAGPNIINPEILKPDITAPGVNIIAAFTGALSPTEEPFDTRRVKFITMSDWSPAAIKSAIMTTARTRDNTVNPMLDGSFNKATPYNYGSGHIRPNRAMNPWIVSGLSRSITVIRRLKNVGSPGTYAAHIREPLGVSVSVEPRILKFEKIGEEKQFKVTLKAKWSGAVDTSFGGLTWTDGKHYVRSPIVVAPINN
ncbi:hypothetical protein Patl1_09640 [Pistacia atlantica]|uniref:Uncharacterized protein n=1 Tax=Pistacia atlantica TaxID=434234 RepID=A0ACC1A828_9ROSI|nr:hypothetical protein Patl1_09640 [Pistacia atlantica]